MSVKIHEYSRLDILLDRRRTYVPYWVVVCDRCGREIDATKEIYHIHDDEDLCQKCHNEA